jgi:nucleotide-binding universal stress UspA family protein
MIRSILVALAESPYDAGAKNVAFWLAKKEGSQLHALAVVDLTAFEMPVLGGPDSFMPSVLSPSLSESQSLMNDLMADARKRLDLFAGECAARGIPVFTEAKTGIPGEVISQTAAAHDIVIVSRIGYSRIASAQETVDAWIAPAVRRSVRPVLVADTEFKEGRDIRNILVAYDGSAHSSRALLAVAELAARPGVQCSLLTVAHSEDLGREVLDPAGAFLSHHGVTAQKQIIINDRPSDVICELASSGGFDIVVMGAFGHSPIREALFGSTTERILSHCAANVILQS